MAPRVTRSVGSLAIGFLWEATPAFQPHFPRSHLQSEGRMPPSELLFILLFLLLLLPTTPPRPPNPAPLQEDPQQLSHLLISVTALAATPTFSRSLPDFHQCRSHCCLPGSCSWLRDARLGSACPVSQSRAPPRSKTQAKEAGTAEQGGPFKVVSLLIPVP